MIRWLHISDLHLGSDGTATAMLRDEMPRFLKEKGLRCNYVFCTGDIRTANANPNNFTDDMSEFLKKICAAVEVSVDMLFIIPGNHDINRDVPGRADSIENAFWTKEKYYDAEQGTVKPDDMANIMAGEQDFKAFLAGVYSPDRLAHYGNANAPHFTIETEHFNVLHVDTTIAYTEGHESTDLVVGTKALYDVIKVLNKTKPTVLLTHFPFDCLRQSEKKQLSTMLQHNGVRLWLSGHEHDKLLKKEQYLDVVQSGELRKEDKTNPSFLIGEYEPSTYGCRVSAYMWYPEGWEQYPYVDLDNTPKNVYCFKLKPAEPESELLDKNTIDLGIQKIANQANSLATELGKLVNKPTIKKANIVLGNNILTAPSILTSHEIRREALVMRCEKELRAGKLVILYGSLKIGKTTLAKQVETAVPGLAIYDNTSANELENIIDTLLRENPNGHSIVVTTTCLNLNFIGFDSTVISQIEVPLLTLEETKALISTYNPTHDLSVFIWSHSNGHPVLIKSLCDYLSTCNWTINESNFRDVLNFTFDYSLSRSIASLMTRIIPDKQDRAFLNRLLLVKGTFTEDEACGIAGIEPAIDEPRLRLSNLTPNWIMPLGYLFRVNPLFDKVWRTDLPQTQYISCQRLLASNILRKDGALDEHDVLNYIIYCMNAGDYDDAGAMYITVMLKIHESKGLPDKSIFRGLWIDIPTPSGMSLNKRIGIRILQLIFFTKIKKIQRRYLLNDLAALVQQCKDKELLPFFNSVVTMYSWIEGDTKTGLEHYKLYLKHKTEGATLLNAVEDSIPTFDSNIWLFLLMAEKAEDYTNWFNSFKAEDVDYSHDDNHICDCCYMSINRFIDYHLQNETIDAKLKELKQIQNQSEVKQCPELAIVSVFKQMELSARDKRYSDACELYNVFYKQYESYPLAQLLLNASIANVYYRDNTVDNKEAIKYFKGAISVENNELIPDIQLHTRQLYAYVMAEEDEMVGISLLEDALKYVDNDNHRVDVYEYYQCAGELSYAYWCAGKQNRAIEVLSPCISFVLSDLNGETSKFAKSYLCICNCLTFKYEFDINNKLLPPQQAVPYRGMFTENDLTAFDDLYSEDRLYTTCYQMCSICRGLGLNTLAIEWAYKTVDACRNRRDVQETHYLIFLLLPLFIVENDLETIRYVISHSCKARLLSYQNHPQLNQSNADFEFVEFQVAPLLMASLAMKLRGNEEGLNLVKEVINEYIPVNDPDEIQLVKSIFDRASYDESFISEINKLDQTKYYVVYVCAYLITALYSDAYYAFSLLIAVLPSLEKQFEQILGIGSKLIINRFVVDFWKARILQAPNEFTNYERLINKGIPLIEQYEGKNNQGNRTMFIVQYHIKGDLTLKPEQEAWLDA